MSGTYFVNHLVFLLFVLIAGAFFSDPKGVGRSILIIALTIVAGIGIVCIFGQALILSEGGAPQYY